MQTNSEQTMRMRKRKLLNCRCISATFAISIAVVVLNGCSTVPQYAPVLNRGPQTSDSECMVWFKHASKVIESQKFETSGFTNEERSDLEHRFGRYCGTFEKVAIFGIKTHRHKKERELVGVAVTKELSNSLLIEGEFDADMLYRFKVRQTNSAHPFTEMKFKVGFGSAKDKGTPDISIIKIERETAAKTNDTN